MLTELIKGAVEGPQLFETVARAVPLVGIATGLRACPWRAGIVNLGTDGADGAGRLRRGGHRAFTCRCRPICASVVALAGGAIVGGPSMPRLRAFGRDFRPACRC